MIERSLAFGPQGNLVGTLCLPDGAYRAGVGQLLFNAGVVHRIGPHRINVRLARSLAGRGIPSVRFDLSGLGDSSRAGSDLRYEDQAVADLRSAMDLLGSSAGVQRFAIFGFCSGGRHGLATAEADERVAGVLMYDAYIYRTWRSRLNLRLKRIRQSGMLRPAARWAMRRFASRMTSGGAAVPAAWTGYTMDPDRQEFARRARALLDRGVQLAVVHSAGFEEYNYRGQFEDVFRNTGLPQRVMYDFLADMGHTASILAAQQALMQRVEDWTLELDARRGDARRPGPGNA